MAIGDEPKLNNAGSDKIEEVENNERLVTRILLAEDDENLRETLVEELEDRGYKVRAFENGQLLMDELAVEQCDIVMSDNSMPVMTGIQLLQKIRATEKTRNLPVIILSGDDDVQKVVEDSCGIYLDKEGESTIADIFAAISKIVESEK